MTIKGFSHYEIDEQMHIYSDITGTRKLLKGSLRDNAIHMRADNGERVSMARAKVLWCAQNNVCPLDFPKGDFCISKKHGVISRADLVATHTKERFAPWKKEESIKELKRCAEDNAMQLHYYETGDMSALLLRFEEYRDELSYILGEQYKVARDAVPFIIEACYDSYIKNLSEFFPIHSIHAYLVGAVKRHMRDYFKKRKMVLQLDDNKKQKTTL